MRFGKTRVQFYRPLELLARRLELVVVPHQRGCVAALSLRQEWIEFERLQHHRQASFPCLHGHDLPGLRPEQAELGEPPVRQGAFRIDVYGLLEVFRGQPHIVRIEALDVELALQEGLVGGRVDRFLRSKPPAVLVVDRDADLAGDFDGDTVLQRKDVLEFVVEGGGPQMLVALCIQKLHRDAHSIPVAQDLGRDDPGNPELPSDGG